MLPAETLIERAEEAMENAYNPYSNYAVGVAVETPTGEVFVGCNVENAAYSPTTHAEQTALVSAIATGNQEFAQLALATTARNGVPPCGFCRQVIREFVPDDFPIHSATEDGCETYTMGELLPDSFGPDDLLAPEDMPPGHRHDPARPTED